ncbi:hypothetical protein LJR009_001598 [Bosea sp. LjRoot9]|uniref:hypothetical protein n=1 Tax=Bosea sp. LjRoot9 TaxID=3342341 RepID=UPI003ED14421
MSLAPTALRLAAVEALSPYAQNIAATPVWPTFAGRQIFDSEIAPVALSEADRSLPVIVVSCDATKTEGYGTAPDVTLPGDGDETATLAFEIMVPVRLVGSDGTVAFDIGPTNALAKALLELIEDQILQRLGEARMNGPLLHVLKSISEIDSQCYSDPDTDIQLTATRLELKCHIRQRSAWPTGSGLEGLDVLPDPLRSVAKELHPESYGGKVALGIAELIGNPAAFPALNELRLALNLTRAPGETAPAPADATATPPIGDVGGSVTL